MKKTVKKCFALLSVLFSLCSCKPEPFSVDKSIENLKSKGWEIVDNQFDLFKITDLINGQIENIWYEDFQVSTIQAYVAVRGPTPVEKPSHNLIIDTMVYFIVFDNEDDTKNYMNALINRTKKEHYIAIGAYVAFSIQDYVYIETNSFEATKLINLNFTLI